MQVNTLYLRFGGKQADVLPDRLGPRRDLQVFGNLFPDHLERHLAPGNLAFEQHDMGAEVRSDGNGTELTLLQVEEEGFELGNGLSLRDLPKVTAGLCRWAGGDRNFA